MSYTAFGLYNNARDARLIVPKRNPRFGWTINIAHPMGGLLLLGLGVAIGAALAGAFVAG